MFDHTGFIVRDIAVATDFYEAALAPLGLQIIERHPWGAIVIAKSEDDAFPFLYIGEGRPSFWGEDHEASRSPQHLGFKAETRKDVDAFYKAALESGGTDNGSPGPRGDDYYAAYVIDPDGNNIEAGIREGPGHEQTQQA